MAETAVFTFVVYTICFIAILLSSPVFTWTTVADCVAYVGAYGGPLRALAQASILPVRQRAFSTSCRRILTRFCQPSTC